MDTYQGDLMMSYYDPIKNYVPQYNEKMENEIVSMFKHEKKLSLDDKILLTNLIIINSNKLINYEDFFEEECHLSLVNWIYNLKNDLKKGYIDNKSYHLLYNILNIFESFPINLKDLLVLNIYQKLNKIRKYMKKINFNIFVKIDGLITYWKEFLNDNCIMINKKRLREDNEPQTQENQKVKIFSFKLIF